MPSSSQLATPRTRRPRIWTPRDRTPLATPDELPPQPDEIPEWLCVNPNPRAPNSDALIRLTFDKYGSYMLLNIDSKTLLITDALKTGYLKEAWRWELVPQEQRVTYFKMWKVWFTWDELLSWRIYYVWLKKVAKRYTDNVGKIAKKRHAPIYQTDEVFQYYKHMRATNKEFVEKYKK
ncbi:hypothetical protein Sjap_026278 [Stephania japonica]|uniref:Uncharacterized protein n=1 Tax=Stephania japonica TaxID=461633 RepID=A0AAP0E6Q1_9MAGN